MIKKSKIQAMNFVISAIALAAFIYFLNDKNYLQEVKLNLSNLLLIVALLISKFFLLALRFLVLTKSLLENMNSSEVVTQYLRSIFWASITPSGVGGEVYKISVLKAYGAKVTHVSVVCIAEKIFGLLSLLLFSIPACLLILHSISINLEFEIIQSYFIFIVLCMIATVFIFRSKRFRLLLNSVMPYLNKKTIGLAILISIIAQIPFISAFYIGLWCCFHEISFKLVLLIPVILLVGLLPMSVGGFGPREAFSGFVSNLIGAEASAGIYASLQFGILLVISTFLIQISVIVFDFFNREKHQID